jgi:heterodisulfide reductase subunit A-like polyferredoxin
VEARISVYICRSGSNIAGTVDTAEVALFAQDLEGLGGRVTG